MPPPRYRDNLARHLIGISRDLQARVRRALAEECGYAGLRPSFGPILSLVWDEGRPLGAIAAELAISSQAASQLASLVEAAGYLARRPNPADRRSKLLTLTRRGRGLVEDGVRIILATDAEYAAHVGAGTYRRFTGALARLHPALELPTHPDAALMARARRSVGLLPLVAVRIERELMRRTAARGHAGLKMSFSPVLSLLGPDGGRIQEIARVQRVSRQAIHAVALELEALGYLARRPDPRDGRGVVLALTRAGETLLRDSTAALAELERGFRDVLGAESLEALRRAARDLYGALRLEAEVFAPPVARVRPTADVRRLATRLRRQLGQGDATRLAALLGTRQERALP